MEDSFQMNRTLWNLWNKVFPEAYPETGFDSIVPEGLLKEPDERIDSISGISGNTKWSFKPFTYVDIEGVNKIWIGVFYSPTSKEVISFFRKLFNGAEVIEEWSKSLQTEEAARRRPKYIIKNNQEPKNQIKNEEFTALGQEFQSKSNIDIAQKLYNKITNDIDDEFKGRKGVKKWLDAKMERFETEELKLKKLQRGCIILENMIRINTNPNIQNKWTYMHGILEVMYEKLRYTLIQSLANTDEESIKRRLKIWTQRYYEFFVFSDESKWESCNNHFLTKRKEAYDVYGKDKNKKVRYWFRRLDPKYFNIERKDKTELQVLTIDPKGSTDADDAFSYYKNSDGTFIEVHIADPTSVKLTKDELWGKVEGYNETDEGKWEKWRNNGDDPKYTVGNKLKKKRKNDKEENMEFLFESLADDELADDELFKIEKGKYEKEEQEETNQQEKVKKFFKNVIKKETNWGEMGNEGTPGYGHLVWQDAKTFEDNDETNLPPTPLPESTHLPQPTDSTIGDWSQYKNPADGKLFWYNAKTEKSSWTPPLKGGGDSSGDEDVLKLTHENFAHPVYLNTQIKVSTNYSLYSGPCHLYPKQIVDKCTLQTRPYAGQIEKLDREGNKHIVDKDESVSLLEERWWETKAQERDALSIKFKIELETIGEDEQICTIDCVDICFSKIKVQSKYTLTYEAAGDYFARRIYDAKRELCPPDNKPLTDNDITFLLHDVFKITEYWRKGHPRINDEKLYYNKLDIEKWMIWSDPQEQLWKTTMMKKLIETLAILTNTSIGKYSNDIIKTKYPFLEGIWRKCDEKLYDAASAYSNIRGTGEGTEEREKDAKKGDIIDHTHAKLGLKDYSWVTSPLRRYEDTYLHMLLKIIFYFNKLDLNSADVIRDINDINKVLTEEAQYNYREKPVIDNSHEHTKLFHDSMLGRKRKYIQNTFKIINIIENNETNRVGGYIMWTKKNKKYSQSEGNEEEWTNYFLTLYITNITINNKRYLLTTEEAFKIQKETNWFGAHVRGQDDWWLGTKGENYYKPFITSEGTNHEGPFIPEWENEIKYEVNIRIGELNQWGFKFINHLYDFKNPDGVMDLRDDILHRILVAYNQKNEYSEWEVIKQCAKDNESWWSEKKAEDTNRTIQQVDKDLGEDNYIMDGDDLINKTVKLYNSVISITNKNEWNIIRNAWLLKENNNVCDRLDDP